MVNGWIPTSLGEILRLEKRPVKLIPDQEYAEIGIYSYGRGIFHKRPRTGFEVGDKDLFEIKSGDFIFQITFAWEGAIALASESEDGMYGSVRFPTYRVNENICDPKFLLQYFKTEEGRREVGRISPGSAGRNRVLATKRLPEIFVPLPPLTEQRRIVAHIESLAARVNEAQRLREEVDAESDLLFGTALKRAYDQAVEIAGKTERLDDLCTTITDGTHVTPTYVDEGVPFLSVKDISSGVIDFSRTRFISPEEHAFLTKRCKPERDDILLTKVGTTGIAKVVDVDREFSIFVSIALLKLDKTRLDPKFTEYMLNSPILKQHSSDGTRGVGNKNLVLKFIKEFPMPVPPLDEQRRIVAYLDGLQAKVNAVRGLQSQSQEELDALLPSVLDRAFKGEL